jgi:predicted RNA-binding protein with PIN domain
MLIIDGHNLIGHARGLSLEDEEAGREQLLRRVGAAKGSGGEQVLVIFDGDHPDRRMPGRFGGLRVAYSAGGRSADDEIITHLERAARKTVTVVTSDRNLAERCRARGASVISAGQFLARLDPKPSKGMESSEKPESGPDEVDRWLSVFEKK